MNLNIKAQKNEVWSFNNSGYYKYQDLTKDSLLHIPNGISEQAIILDSKQKQYLSVPFTPNESAFSVSFWFQVNDNKTYPLLRQTQTENKKIEQFVGVVIKDNKIYIQGELRKIELLDSIYKCNSKKWHFLTYTFDGKSQYQVFINKNLIKKFELVTLSSKRPNRVNAIEIGKGSGNSYFNGKLDELQINETVITPEQVAKICEQLKPPEDEPSELKMTNNDKAAKDKGNNLKIQRPEKIIDTITIYSTFLELEIWDNDVFNKCNVDIYMNKIEAYKNIEVPKMSKRKKETYIVSLTQNFENTLVFSAINLGKLSTQRTLGLHVYELDQNKQRLSDIPLNTKPYVFLHPTDTNVALQIAHDDKPYKQHIDVGMIYQEEIELKVLSNSPNLLQYLDIRTRNTFVMLKSEKTDTTLLCHLKLKNNARNSIPLKIENLHEIPKDASFNITLFNKENGQVIYQNEEPFPFRNNYSINLSVKHEEQEEEVYEINKKK